MTGKNDYIFNWNFLTFSIFWIGIIFQHMFWENKILLVSGYKVYQDLLQHACKEWEYKKPS